MVPLRAVGGRTHLAALTVLLVLVLGVGAPASESKPYPDPMRWRQQLVRVLGTTLNHHNQPVGVVGEVVVGLEQRDDHRGIVVTFEHKPGQFSPRAQVAVLSAIDRTARTAGLNTDSWSVSLAVPLEGLTIYGESLSAMVGLTVVALAKGDFIPPDHVITGTVTLDGLIGTVSGVPLKVQAAGQEGIKRILVPEQAAEGDGEWRTPFLAQVSPVHSVPEAYEALTGHSLQLVPERH